MVRKKRLILLISIVALICVSFLFRNVISSFVITLFLRPYISSCSINESKDKDMFLFKYQPSKDILYDKEGMIAIRIIDTVFVEKKHKLSCKNRKGIEAIDSSFILIIPCQYEDSVFQNYFYKWNLNSPFSAHPKRICAHFEQGSANKYTFPPDTLMLSLINVGDTEDGTFTNNTVIDSIILIKNCSLPQKNK